MGIAQIRIRIVKIVIMLPLFLMMTSQISGQPLRVGVVGLSHDHVFGILNQFRKGEVIIVGIAEENKSLANRFKADYHLPDSLFFKTVEEMLQHIKPDAVMAFNAIADHLSVVEACAPKGISVMVEKPLATTVEQARRMAALVKQYGIHLLTNYETTWYSSNQQVYEMVHKENVTGQIRKMVVHMGHQGPQEIGCTKDFLSWLTDPIKNGGGALIDFGCYGANIMTWLMEGKAPLSVTAITKQMKPNIYPKVDDDATILLEYPGAIGIIEASWNWPYGIKDLEVFGEKSYLHSLNSNAIERRDTVTYYKVNVKPARYVDNLTYLSAVLRGKVNPANDLSSLENNLLVVQILEAARESARTGKKITF